MILKCSNSVSAYCFEWSFTDIGAAILGCTDTPGLTLPAVRIVADDITSTLPPVASATSLNPSEWSYTPSAMNSVATNYMSTAFWVSTIATFGAPSPTLPTGPVTVAATGVSGTATGSSGTSNALEGVSKHQEPIVAGAVGGAAALAIIVGAVLFCALRRKGERRR
ncbi:hypothetical protein LTR27_012438 [Elasticomyces elasticus]|nr:hypothetical protein LTR27_012438 [Elasticomyces elasticus]